LPKLDAYILELSIILYAESSTSDTIAMTATSRAAIFHKIGEGLKVTEVEVNHPAPGEVLIRNHAVALQPLDAKILIAGYGPATSLKYPAILGSSGAGVVQKVGEGVTDFTRGDRVVFDTKAYAKPDENRKQGTWQQLVICEARTVAKVSFSVRDVAENMTTNAVPDW
jgi:NADPH:quinone reductase-like Zn-dependent oxidoreductase